MIIHLIDGYGFIFRAYHSLPPLSTNAGTPISGVYGFINMIMKMIEVNEADGFAVALDCGAKNHRHSLFPEYKANRVNPPDELKIQFPIIREALLALNIPIIEDAANEADDLIATYAIAGARAGHEMVVISSDKDLMQLLAYDGITMRDPMKNKDVTANDVKAKFGVTPSQLCDALSLIGDKSDNIPGVRGIGPKIAAELISHYSSLNGIYANIEKIASKRIQNLLIENKENAFLSQKLVTLKHDLNMHLNFADMLKRDVDSSKALEFAKKFDLKFLIKKYSNNTAGYLPNNNTNIQLNEITIDKINEEFIEKLSNASEVAIYRNQAEYKLFIATKDLNISVYYSNKDSLNLFEDDSNKTSFNFLMTALKPIFESDSIMKIFLNAKKEIKALYDINIGVNGFDDVLLMSYVINTQNKHSKLEDLPLNSYDAIGLLQYWATLKNQLVQQKMLALYEQLEKPLIKLLANVESHGVLINTEKLNNISLELKSRANDIEEKIYKMAQKRFNIGSPKQLAEVLFYDLKLPNINKNPGKNGYSTDSDVLDALVAQGYEIAALILEWRHLTKLINTYTDGLQSHINPSGKICTTFEMNMTSTGRLSSRHPNLQNIPIKTNDGKKIRESFIASPGNILISADYSQIELRLLAHFADIKQLQEAFLAHQDIHSVTASEIFNIPLQNVTLDLRRKAKGINFGIIYGISPFGLAKNIGISQNDAKNYIANYFIKYPGIQEYMKQSIAFAKENGFVQTLMGRRCFIDGINSSNYNARSFAERAAINAPLQGSSADIIKKAMVSLKKPVSNTLILQIHDELLFDVPESNAKEYKSHIIEIMEHVVKLSVPLNVDVFTGYSWS